MKENCKCSGNSIVRSKGEYTVIVTRLTFNIKQNLPYVIWGSIYLNGENFATAIRDYLPAGVTATSEIVGETVVLTYTKADHTDRIVISTAADESVSYVQMIANLKTNYLKSELVYFCNNALPPIPILTNDQNKFLQSTPLYLVKIGGLSEKSTETIIPYTRKVPNNSVLDVSEIYLRHQDVKPNTNWIHVFAWIKLSGTTPSLGFYWQLIINDIVNINEENMNIQQLREKSKT